MPFKEKWESFQSQKKKGEQILAMPEYCYKEGSNQKM